MTHYSNILSGDKHRIGIRALIISDKGPVGLSRWVSRPFKTCFDFLDMSIDVRFAASRRWLSLNHCSVYVSPRPLKTEDQSKGLVIFA